MELHIIRITAKSGRTFGHRMCNGGDQDASEPLATSNPDNLQMLAAGIELISRTPDSERVVVPVSPSQLDQHLDAYLTMLATLTQSQAKRLIIELRNLGEDEQAMACAYRLARYVRDRMHICVAAWAYPDQPGRLSTILRRAQPNLLLIHGAAAETDANTGTRATVLDILEIAQRHDCIPVLDGIESASTRDWYFEIGVRLFSDPSDSSSIESTQSSCPSAEAPSRISTAA